MNRQQRRRKKMNRQQRRRHARERESAGTRLQDLADMHIPDDALCVLVVTVEDVNVTLLGWLPPERISVAADRFAMEVHEVVQEVAIEAAHIPDDALCVLVVTVEDINVTVPETMPMERISVAAKRFAMEVHEVVQEVVGA